MHPQQATSSLPSVSTEPDGTAGVSSCCKFLGEEESNSPVADGADDDGTCGCTTEARRKGEWRNSPSIRRTAPDLMSGQFCRIIAAASAMQFGHSAAEDRHGRGGGHAPPPGVADKARKLGTVRKWRKLFRSCCLRCNLIRGSRLPSVDHNEVNSDGLVRYEEEKKVGPPAAFSSSSLSLTLSPFMTAFESKAAAQGVV